MKKRLFSIAVFCAVLFAAIAAGFAFAVPLQNDQRNILRFFVLDTTTNPPESELRREDQINTWIIEEVETHETSDETGEIYRLFVPKS